MTAPLPRRTFLGAAASLLGLAVAPRVVGAVDLWTTFQTPEAFLQEVFGGAPPPAKVLDHGGKKLRYWRLGGRTAWIFDDLGKPGYQLTTAGFVVKAGAIEHAKVLIYRESRGEQVAQPSFLQKLVGAKLAGSGIDRKVDNISGATLSVLMMQRMAASAITYDSLAR